MTEWIITQRCLFHSHKCERALQNRVAEHQTIPENFQKWDYTDPQTQTQNASQVRYETDPSLITLLHEQFAVGLLEEHVHHGHVLPHVAEHRRLEHLHAGLIVIEAGPSPSVILSTTCGNFRYISNIDKNVFKPSASIAESTSSQSPG